MNIYNRKNIIKTFFNLTENQITGKEKKLPIGIDGLSCTVFKKNLINNSSEIERKVQNLDYRYSSLLAVEKTEKEKNRHLYIPRIRDQIIFKIMHQDIINSAKKSNINLKISYPSSVLKNFKSDVLNFKNPIIIRTDIKNFYGSIPKTDVVNEAISLNPTFQTKYLLDQFKNVKARYSTIMTSSNDFKVNGLPLGVSLSSSLSELWAIKIDRFLSKFNFYRYVDDILIISKNHTEAKLILNDFISFLKTIDLNLSEQKTNISNLDNGIFWLGLQHFNKRSIVQKNKVEKWFKLFLNKKKYFSNQINKTNESLQKQFLFNQFIEEIINEINGKTSSRVIWYSNADNLEIWKDFDKKIHSLIKSILRQSNASYSKDFPSVYRKIKMIKNRTPNS